MKISKGFVGGVNKSLAPIAIYGLAIFIVLLLGLAVVGLFITTHPLFCWVLTFFVSALALTQTNWIARELKKYFLWIVGNQTSGDLLSISFLWAMELVFFLSVLFIFNVKPVQAKIIGNFSAAMFVIITIALPIINRIVVKKKITVLNLADNQIALVYYTDPCGKIIFYEKPLWGKFPFSIIELPDGWMIGMEKNVLKDFKGEVCFDFKDQTITNRPVLVPVRIKFSFCGPFRAQDFGNFLPIQLSPEVISLQDEIKKTFLDSITPESKSDLHVEVTDFFTHRITQRIFLNDILASIEFPKNLFSNAKETIISLEAPRFIFEKTI